MWLVVIPGPSCSPQLCRCASNSRTRRATLGGHALGLWCRRTLVRHRQAALCTRLFSRRTLRISCMVPVTMSPCTGTLYCLFIWKRCHVECGCKCVKGRNAAARTLLSHPTPPPRIWRRCHVECGCKCVKGRNAAARTLLSHPTPPHLETMPCWVWPQVCQRKERSCQDVIIPPHPTPPASGDDAMLSVAASVTEEGTQLPGRDYPTPPHRIWRRCHVECGHKCVKGRNAAARTLLSHPTPPHPPASGDDAMLSVATSVSEEGTQLPGRHYPTPPHPTHPTPIPRIWRRCHVECGRKCVRGRNAAARTLLSHPTPPRIWRRCYVDCGRNCDADVGFWVVRMVVGEWPFFGCEILLFWLRNRLFLVAESPFFGCGIVFFWLRKRLFLVAEARLILVAEASKYGFGIGIYSIWGHTVIARHGLANPGSFLHRKHPGFSIMKYGCFLYPAWLCHNSLLLNMVI